MTINKRFVALVLSIISLSLAAGLFFFFAHFGEALTFAVTNRAQVLQEKADFNAYLSNYGHEAPKAN